MDQMIDAIFRKMTSDNLLQTKFNPKTKQQELKITNFGMEFYKVLDIFVNRIEKT